MPFINTDPTVFDLMQRYYPNNTPDKPIGSTGNTAGTDTNENTQNTQNTQNN